MAELKNPNAVKVLEYVVAQDGKNFTAADITEATGIPKKSVDGIVTMTFQRHKNGQGDIVPLMVREKVTVKKDDNTTDTVTFIRLTDDGRAFAKELFG